MLFRQPATPVVYFDQQTDATKCVPLTKFAFLIDCTFFPFWPHFEVKKKTREVLQPVSKPDELNLIFSHRFKKGT